MQTRQPLVTVVIPAYNVAGYVAEAVSSILGQTYGNLEVIVVDDGSTDATPEVLEGLVDPRLRVVRQENAGIAAALNCGLAFATGDYVARMDADDVSAPDRLQRQVEFLEANPTTALVGSCFRVVDDAGRPQGTVPVLMSDAQLRRDLFTRCPFGHGTVVVRRSALLETGGYRAEAVPAEDYDLWSRLMLNHEVANLPLVLYDWRRHGENTSVGAQRAARDAVTDSVWSSREVAPFGWRQAASEVHEIISVAGPLRWRLLHVYVQRHWVLAFTCVSRRRWRDLLRLAPGAAILAPWAVAFAAAAAAAAAPVRLVRRCRMVRQ